MCQPLYSPSALRRATSLSSSPVLPCPGRLFLGLSSDGGSGLKLSPLERASRGNGARERQISNTSAVHPANSQSSPWATFWPKINLDE